MKFFLHALAPALASVPDEGPTLQALGTDNGRARKKPEIPEHLFSIVKIGLESLPEQRLLGAAFASLAGPEGSGFAGVFVIGAKQLVRKLQPSGHARGMLVSGVQGPEAIRCWNQFLAKLSHPVGLVHTSPAVANETAASGRR